MPDGGDDRATWGSDENIAYTVKQPSVAALVASTSREAVSRETVDAHHMFSVASLTH